MAISAMVQPMLQICVVICRAGRRGVERLLDDVNAYTMLTAAAGWAVLIPASHTAMHQQHHIQNTSCDPFTRECVRAASIDRSSR